MISRTLETECATAYGNETNVRFPAELPLFNQPSRTGRAMVPRSDMSLKAMYDAFYSPHTIATGISMARRIKFPLAAETSQKALQAFCIKCLVLAAAIFLGHPARSQEISCQGFAEYLHASSGLYSTHDDYQMLEGYFKKDLHKKSMSEIQALSDWMRGCERYFNEVLRDSSPSNQAASHDAFDKKLDLNQGLHYMDNVQQGNQQQANEEQGALRSEAANEENAKLIEDIPSCDNRETITRVKTALESSRGLQAIGLKDFLDVSSGELRGRRACEADALFDTGERQIEYTVKWFDKVQGQLSVSVRLGESR